MEAGAEGEGGGQQAKHQKGGKGVHGPSVMGGASTHTSPTVRQSTEEPGGQPPRDETLQDPHCVMQLLRKHFARYTPEFVAQTCGCSPEQVIEVAETLAANSGPERTSAICYAVGWTQHTTGVQIIRAAVHPADPARKYRASRRRAFSRCAATPASRVPPTSPRSTICCPAISRSPSRWRITRRWTATAKWRGWRPATG